MNQWVASLIHAIDYVFAMFHARIDDEDKEAILKSMADPKGTCRIVFSTIAFWYGSGYF